MQFTSSFVFHCLLLLMENISLWTSLSLCVTHCVHTSMNVKGQGSIRGFFGLIFSENLERKKISNDQELIQSDPISCPQNQKEITKYIN